jgi:hypothetical protein
MAHEWQAAQEKRSVLMNLSVVIALIIAWFLLSYSEGVVPQSPIVSEPSVGIHSNIKKNKQKHIIDIIRPEREKLTQLNLNPSGVGGDTSTYSNSLPQVDEGNVNKVSDNGEVDVPKDVKLDQKTKEEVPDKLQVWKHSHIEFHCNIKVDGLYERMDSHDSNQILFMKQSSAGESTYYLYQSKHDHWVFTSTLEKVEQNKGIIQSSKTGPSPIGLSFKSFCNNRWGIEPGLEVSVKSSPPPPPPPPPPPVQQQQHQSPKQQNHKPSHDELLSRIKTPKAKTEKLKSLNAFDKGRSPVDEEDDEDDTSTTNATRAKQLLLQSERQAAEAVALKAQEAIAEVARLQAQDAAEKSSSEPSRLMKMVKSLSQATTPNPNAPNDVIAPDLKARLQSAMAQRSKSDQKYEGGKRLFFFLLLVSICFSSMSCTPITANCFLICVFYSLHRGSG